MADKAKGRLRITAGAGEGHEIDAEVASRYSGRPVRDALMGIIQDEVKDPELQQMLAEPRLALELYGGEDDDGEPQEVPLSPTEQWDRVLKELEDADIEVGIARSHAGGGRRSSKRGRSRALQDRFPRQTVVAHPPDYAPTVAERAEVIDGKTVFLAGSVLAKAECICRELGGREALWYYAAPSDDTLVIREVIIPEQTGSGAYCRSDGSDVLKAAREARRRQLRIVAAGHSHGWLGVFSSSTDWNQMAELARERVARIALVKQGADGQVRQLAASEDGTHAVEFSFPGNPETTIRITSANNSADGPWPGKLTVRLEQTHQRFVSWFATHNQGGKHLVPMLEVVSCAHCSSKQERQIDPSKVVVHVVGPVTLSKVAREAVRKEVREKVKTYSWWGYGSGTSVSEDDEPNGISTDRCPGVETHSRKEPASFDISRRGELIATVSATTLERAAAETPSLAIALGWESAEEQPQRQEEPVHG